MYQLIANPIGPINVVLRIQDRTSIPFAPDNTDYARFKREIEAGTAQLQDADGQPMSVADANAFVATLP